MLLQLRFCDNLWNRVSHLGSRLEISRRERPRCRHHFSAQSNVFKAYEDSACIVSRRTHSRCHFLDSQVWNHTFSSNNSVLYSWSDQSFCFLRARGPSNLKLWNLPADICDLVLCRVFPRIDRKLLSQYSLLFAIVNSHILLPFWRVAKFWRWSCTLQKAQTVNDYTWKSNLRKTWKCRSSKLM